MTEHKDNFINPIDEDLITDRPSTLPYAHERGGQLIKPIDKGRLKGNALSAMYEQSDMHLDQIREQIELLAKQAQDAFITKQTEELEHMENMSAQYTNQATSMDEAAREIMENVRKAEEETEGGH